MDDLTNHCKGLSISDKEGPTFDLDEAMATSEFIIAGNSTQEGLWIWKLLLQLLCHCRDQRMASKSKI